MHHKLLHIFPGVIFLAVMLVPLSVHLSSFAMVSIPLLVAIWLCVANYQYPICLPKPLLYMLLLLVASQFLLLFFGVVGAVEPMLLGLIWIVIGVVAWATMPQLQSLEGVIYHSFLLAALCWSILGLYVWFGMTDNGSPLTVLGMIALTQPADLKIIGPFANGNVFAILMLCAWCIATAFMVREKEHMYWYGLASFFFLLLVFMSMSRGAWLAWLCVLLLLLIGLYKQRKFTFILYVLLSGVVAWLCAEFVVEYVHGAIYMADRTDRIIEPGVRVTLYASVFEVWREHWLLGVGFGNLGGHYLTGQAEALSYLPSHFTSLGATKNAHNHFLHVLAEAGMVGVALWCLVSFVLLRNMWMHGGDVGSKAWCSFSVAFVLWFQGLFNVSMLEPIPFFLFCVALGLGMSLVRGASAESVPTVGRRYIMVILCLFIVTLTVQTVVVTKNWNLYTHMFWAKSGLERGPYVQELMKYEATYPILIQQITMDMMAREDKQKQMVLLQGHIQKALRLEEWPLLYQSLFYTYTLQANWDKACVLGKFLQQQRWANDLNGESYNAACQGEKVEGFSLAW